MSKHNCKPVAMFPHTDSLFGSDWIINNIRALKSHSVLETWAGYLEKVGQTFWYQSFGEWTLFTNEPENIKKVLATDFESWAILGPRMKAFTMSIGNHSILSVNGTKWRNARAMMRPAFVRNQVADLACLEKHVNNLLDKIPKDGSTIELQDLLYKMTMDSAADFLFGHSTNTLTKPTKESSEFFDAFEYTFANSAARIRLGWLAPLMPNAKFNNSLRIVKRFLDKYITEALANTAKDQCNYVFLNELSASGAPHDYIREQVHTLMVAGRDTTASALTSLFWILSRHPAIVKNLRQEIQSEIGTERPTWEQLKNMHYLNMALKEALRLYSPVSTTSRTAVKDTILPRGGGDDGMSPVFITAGSVCRWSSYSLHRRKDIFGDDADVFRPERWENLRTAWAYLPFGGGPRVCVGQQFALTEMAYVTTRIFQMFEGIEARDGSDFTMNMGTTIKLVNGCYVVREQKLETAPLVSPL
ncbi:cytochrome P450 [Thozetella sp. PMI_491]|nr:cytochrome P450 [Thozetella sp. PMI_491]